LKSKLAEHWHELSSDPFPPAITPPCISADPISVAGPFVHSEEGMVEFAKFMSNSQFERRDSFLKIAMLICILHTSYIHTGFLSVFKTPAAACTRTRSLATSVSEQ
jgi:hypothetical protein